MTNNIFVNLKFFCISFLQSRQWCPGSQCLSSNPIQWPTKRGYTIFLGIMSIEAGCSLFSIQKRIVLLQCWQLKVLDKVDIQCQHSGKFQRSQHFEYASTARGGHVSGGTCFMYPENWMNPSTNACHICREMLLQIGSSFPQFELWDSSDMKEKSKLVL